MFDGWLALATGATVTLAHPYAAGHRMASQVPPPDERDRLEANTKAIESLLNYETVKYFGNEEHEARRFDASLSRYERAAVRSQVNLSILNIGQAAIISAGLTLVMWMAAQGIAEAATLGDFVLVNTYLLQLYSPLSFFGFIYREIKQAIIDMERGLLDQDREIADRPGARDLAVSGAEVEFRDVRFGYDERRPILKGVSFRIPAGKTVAVVGPSGAGKSTIARLLFRFYDDRRHLIDGQDLREVTQQSVRAAIGVVPQDTVLFNDTIRYNIGYGHPGASDAEIEAAARLAHVHDLIMAMPDGYGTMVGERGLKLSGGEKQRVAIARTLLKNPAVFLFDSHQRAGHPPSARSGQPARSQPGSQHAHHRAPAVDRGRRRRDHRAGRWPGGRARPPPGTAGARRRLRRHVGAAAAKPGGLTSPPHCPKIAPLNPRPRHAGIPAAPEVLVCSAADLVNGGLGVKCRCTMPPARPRPSSCATRTAHGYLNRCAHVGVELDWEGSFFTRAGDLIMCARHGATYQPDTGLCVGGPARTAASRRWMCRNATARSIGAPPARSARWTPPERGPSRRRTAGVLSPGSGPYGEAGSRPGPRQTRAGAASPAAGASGRHSAAPAPRRPSAASGGRSSGQHHDAHLRRAEQHGRQRNARGQRFLRATEHQRDLVLLDRPSRRAPQVVISSTAPSNTALTSTMVARSSGGKACQMPCATASLKAV